MPIYVVQLWQAFEHATDPAWAEGNADWVVENTRVLAEQSALVNAGEPTEATSWSAVFEMDEVTGELTATGKAWHMGADGIVRDVLPSDGGGGGGTAEEWEPDTAYAVNDEVTYQGPRYRCLQAHTSLLGWEPPNVPALWEPI